MELYIEYINNDFKNHYISGVTKQLQKYIVFSGNVCDLKLKLEEAGYKVKIKKNWNCFCSPENVEIYVIKYHFT